MPTVLAALVAPRGLVGRVTGWLFTACIFLCLVSGVRVYQATKEGQRWRAAKGLNPWMRADGSTRRPTPGWFFWLCTIGFSVLGSFGLGAVALVTVFGSSEAPEVGPGLVVVAFVSIFLAPLVGVAVGRSIRPRKLKPARPLAVRTPAGLPPAGWFPDPQQASRLRYWDGDRWTEHVY
jgi:hypothetical protein